jgi:hypothetical protein
MFVGEAKTSGSGWVDELCDGSEVKYYVALSPEFHGEVNLHLPDAPKGAIGKPLPDDKVGTLAGAYVSFLESVVAEAKERFL